MSLTNAKWEREFILASTLHRPDRGHKGRLPVCSLANYGFRGLPNIFSLCKHKKRINLSPPLPQLREAPSHRAHLCHSEPLLIHPPAPISGVHAHIWEPSRSRPLSPSQPAGSPQGVSKTHLPEFRPGSHAAATVLWVRFNSIISCFPKRLAFDDLSVLFLI